MSKKTVDLCYYKEPTGASCNEKVQWKVATERGHTFKVCDQHLAWGLRFSGLPAKVDEFPKTTSSRKTQTMKISNS